MKRYLFLLFFGVFHSLVFAFQTPLVGYDNKFKPVLSADGQVLIFNRIGYYLNQGSENLSDIWLMEKLPGGEWGIPIQLSGPINDEGNNEIMQVDFFGNQAFIRNEKKVFKSVQKGNFWKIDEELQFPWDFEDIFIAEKDRIAFVSTSEKLFFSKKNKDGLWEPLQKLNFQVSGNRSERNPFLSADGRTLYFSSNSFGGFGGMDLFVSRRIGEGWENWTVPQNLGAAVNSVGDELDPFTQWDGDKIWFTRKLSKNQSEILSAPLAEQYKPEPLLFFSALNCPSGALISVSEGGEILNSYQNNGTLQALIKGGQPLLVRFEDQVNKFIPLVLVEGNLVQIEEADYDPTGIYDILINDISYKNREQRILALQKEVLDTERKINEISGFLNQYIVSLSPPVTPLIENTGFRTDKVLQRIEEDYYKELGIDLTNDTLLGNLKPSFPSREERVGTLKRGIFNQEQEINEDNQPSPPSFTAIRERTRRALEAELLEEVWLDIFQNSNRSAKEAVRKAYNREEFKNIIRSIGILDSLNEGWWPQFKSPEVIQFEFPEIENRLKEHIRPLVIQAMVSLIKNEVEGYTAKLYELDFLFKIRALYLPQLDALNVAQREREKRVDSKEDKIPTGLNGEIKKIKEVIISPNVFSLVAGQNFELGAIVFKSNSSSLTEWARFELDRLGELLNRYPKLKFVLRVHTHPQMSVTFADDLTESRAEKIRKYMERRGVDLDRLEVVGFGKKKPLVLSQNQASKIRNQRVELFIEKS
ncbi:MAG: hypothetical protein RJA52_1393 [Bacteroidota bacterium]